MSQVKVLIEYNGGDGFYFAEGESVDVTSKNEYLLTQLIAAGQAELVDDSVKTAKRKKKDGDQWPMTRKP